MYDELKTKCEKFKAEIMAVLPELTESDGRIKDIRSGNLLQYINSSARELTHVINTINAYYSED